ncbi:ATP-binding protein [Streptomyces griseoviridis]|uniref:ATP-binding protein n=1 Tax=Streptomyces griseoviridis TaxID=45398 RepID=UPI0033F8B4E8
MALSAFPTPWSDPTGRPNVPPRHTPRAAALLLSGTSHECAEARRFTVRTLAAWESEHLADDARTVVGELTANAVRHARAHRPLDTAEAEIRLKLTLRPAHLLISVTDHGDDLPAYPPPAGDLDTAGRGLRVVEALSDHWGWTRYRPTGKTVWALLPLRPRS